MHTERLYYQDPYIDTFSAKILHKGQDQKGRLYVVLDKTAFYPTGGGQPHDIGTLNHVQVYDVEDVEGEIRHFIDVPLQEDSCYGKVNWIRRLDHMQQHAGQHILSASFEELFGYKTVSFHLSTETCTVDLDITTLTEEEANKAEERVNQIILENRPIETKWVTEDEIHQYPLRKALSVTDNIRLVIIPEFDYNGCGGTHPNSTGQVNQLKILQWEKQKKKIRIHFVCGTRVLKQLHEKHRIIQRLTPLLNAPQEDLESAAKRLIEQQKIFEATISELKMEILKQEGSKLIEESIDTDHFHLVKNISIDRSITELQQLAKHITQNEDSILVLFVNKKEEKLQVICARSEDLDQNMNQLLKDVLPAINGKGGGSDSFAQGGGEPKVSPEDLIDKMLNVISTDF
ncbi:alanyl-tRNA editing protein [Oceanobacillus piezotolerans]|uniref:Alanine--tRNA ligase n=1 Tax=Oceanobacillus piezotolerans TaxID=2448030 RepID=A0A498DMI4_9BACI|nr:DHHA1 domain-containing protein [Oceanobacillus piezotolerans]RLL48260.1 alanyl-tRNA editing protein [Oceanobacillus piezotolerans]